MKFPVSPNDGPVGQLVSRFLNREINHDQVLVALKDIEKNSKLTWVKGLDAANAHVVTQERYDEIVREMEKNA